MNLSDLKAQIESRKIFLSEALVMLLEMAGDNLTLLESLWIQNETKGYQLSLSEIEGTPDGMVESAAASIIPLYRTLASFKTLAAGPISGIEQDISDTDYGRMPILITDSIKTLEDSLLPLLKAKESIGFVDEFNGIQAKKFVNPTLVQAMFDDVKDKTLHIIARLESE